MSDLKSIKIFTKGMPILYHNIHYELRVGIVQTDPNKDGFIIVKLLNDKNKTEAAIHKSRLYQYDQSLYIEEIVRLKTLVQELETTLDSL